MDNAELRLILHDLDSNIDEDESFTFTLARDIETNDGYAHAIVTQVELRGALFAACADVASAIGSCDYDEAIAAVRAMVPQWQHVADVLDSWDPTAVQVRMAASSLDAELRRDDLDLEMLADLVTLASLEDELRNHAASVAMADQEEASGDEYLREHATRIEEAFGMLSVMKADLRNRGELGLDDELLPRDETDERGDV